MALEYPKKRPNELQQDFMDRCMSDPVMMTTFFEPSQRAAVCMEQSGMKPKVGGEGEQDVGERENPPIRLSGRVNIFKG
jgi:hypothetical protein